MKYSNDLELMKVFCKFTNFLKSCKGNESMACKRIGYKPSSITHLKNRVIKVTLDWIDKVVRKEYTKFNKKEYFIIDGTIVTPKVKYIPSNYNEGKHGKLYHSILTETMNNNGSVNITTLGCDSMDKEGFCKGHTIKKIEFIDKYCDGVYPEELKINLRDLV